MSKIDLTAERLRELLDYDPETGRLTCRVKLTSRRRPGSVAGYRRERYRAVNIFGHVYKEHRLVWLYMTGAWPTNSIDHIDGDGHNNRFSNLRDIPQTHNTQNERQARVTSHTGFLGVNRNKNRFRARIRTGDKLIHIGSFKTPEEAHAAYVAAKRKYHPGTTL